MPHPDGPGEWLINGNRMEANQGSAQDRLISKASSNILCRRNVRKKQEGDAEQSRPPVVRADESRITRDSIQGRLPAHLAALSLHSGEAALAACSRRAIRWRACARRRCT